ncbi:MAG: hypothetical protein ABR583_03750 [Gaiellaceae bacterium]
MLAILRTSDWEVPLFLHVAGAMVLVGALFAVAVALVAAWRAEDADAAALTRFSYRTLFLAALPAFIAMRIGAQWVLSESPYEAVDLGWVGVGYLVSDLGGVALIASLVLAGIGLRRAGPRSQTLARAVTVLTLVLLAAYLIAVWAMTTKPD